MTRGDIQINQLYLEGDACRERQSGGKTRVSKSRDLFGFSPDCLRKRHEILQRIIKHRNANTKQSQNNPLVTSEKHFSRIPQKRIDYFNEGKNYVVYKNINNVMGVAGNRIRHEHITSHTTVSGI